jgi:hypothetical protein
MRLGNEKGGSLRVAFCISARRLVAIRLPVSDVDTRCGLRVGGRGIVAPRKELHCHQAEGKQGRCAEGHQQQNEKDGLGGEFHGAPLFKMMTVPLTAGARKLFLLDVTGLLQFGYIKKIGLKHK